MSLISQVGQANIEVPWEAWEEEGYEKGITDLVAQLRKELPGCNVNYFDSPEHVDWHVTIRLPNAITEPLNKVHMYFAYWDENSAIATLKLDEGSTFVLNKALGLLGDSWTTYSYGFSSYSYLSIDVKNHWASEEQALEARGAVRRLQLEYISHAQIVYMGHSGGHLCIEGTSVYSQRGQVDWLYHFLCEAWSLTQFANLAQDLSKIEAEVIEFKKVGLDSDS
jgi:hypothetical protein